MNRDGQVWRERLQACAPGDVRSVCESVLAIWPASSEAWLRLLAAAPPDERAELFTRCLPATQDPQVFAAYVQHVRETKPEELQSAYEFVLQQLFADPAAGALWREYIEFLQQEQTTNEWEEQFKMDKVRKAFKRAVSLPLDNVEMLWRKYGQFENRISRVSARKFVDERSPFYMRARQCLRGYQQISRGLAVNSMPSPAESAETWLLWRAAVELECKNILELEPSELAQRVCAALKKGVIYARFAPEMWFYAGTVAPPGADISSAQFLTEGLRAMPDSPLLVFRLAAERERQQDFPAAKQVILDYIAACGGEPEDPETRMDTDASERDTAATNVRKAHAYAELSRFAHRAEGREAARSVLRTAFKTLKPTVDLYLAACDSERGTDLELQFFRLGFADFPVPELAEPYLQSLYACNDMRNARSVFEQARQVSPLPQRVWDLVLYNERRHYRSAAQAGGYLDELERLYAETFNRSELEMFTDRFGIRAPAQHVEAATLDPKLQNLLNMLPPPEMYDGPVLNIETLMQLVVNCGV